jgi:hypothetical protein
MKAGVTMEGGVRFTSTREKAERLGSGLVLPHASVQERGQVHFPKHEKVL